MSKLTTWRFDSFSLRKFAPVAVLLLMALVRFPRYMAAAEKPAKPPIDLSDLDAVRAQRPILIAHRGGVVTADSPECSLTAVRRAAEEGYQLVELDVRPTKDDFPVVFHDRNLEKATGRAGTVRDLELAEVRTIRYRAVDESITTLDEALALCKSLGLGVMLDVKDAESAPMLKRAAELVTKHGLERSTITLNSDPRIAGALGSVSLVQIKARDAVKKEGRPGKPLQGYFWLGLPQDFPEDDSARWQREGVLILPAINTFRYPADRHEELAARDIVRLQKLGVDGFQIDSVYQRHFGLPRGK